MYLLGLCTLALLASTVAQNFSTIASITPTTADPVSPTNTGPVAPTTTVPAHTTTTPAHTTAATVPSSKPSGSPATGASLLCSVVTLLLYSLWY